MRTKVVSFSCFPRAFQQKTKELGPKMTKRASRGSCLNLIWAPQIQQLYSLLLWMLLWPNFFMSMNVDICSRKWALISSTGLRKTSKLSELAYFEVSEVFSGKKIWDNTIFNENIQLPLERLQSCSSPGIHVFRHPPPPHLPQFPQQTNEAKTSSRPISNIHSSKRKKQSQVFFPEMYTLASGTHSIRNTSFQNKIFFAPGFQLDTYAFALTDKRVGLG